MAEIAITTTPIAELQVTEARVTEGLASIGARQTDIDWLRSGIEPEPFLDAGPPDEGAVDSSRR
ncbi:MAG: hypothetical protein KF764_26675 [Labilithrix sp.]|nr:hypothetical protein [Labilithrix sp.]